MANFCTWNPLRVNTTAALSSVGNLLATMNNNSQAAIAGTIDVVSGKWYWEVLINQINAFVGVTVSTYNGYANITGIDGSLHYHASNGNIYEGTGGASTNTAYGATSGDGDVIGVALNMDDRTIAFYKNGTLLAAAVSLPHTGVGYTPSFSTGTSGAVVTGMANFGQLPWRYDPPSGFLALSTENLAEPSISNLAAEKPEDHFGILNWTGTGGNRTIADGESGVTGTVNFTPDLIWTKSRSSASSHMLYDSIRGFGNSSELSPNQTIAEGGDNGDLSGYVSGNTSGGFTTVAGSSNADLTNTSSRTYVAWCWKAGGTAVSNTNGSITSQVSANTDAGFSIVSYTGTGSAATVGHGLNTAPSLIIVKPRNETANWVVYHSSVGATKYLLLNTTATEDTASTVWNNTAPTSSVFSLGTNTNVNGNTTQEIAYCWSEVEGFSKIGEWNNNNSTDGSFIYCGFRPAFILLKNTDNVENWYIQDNQRPTYNYGTGSGQYLNPNTTNTEATNGAGTAAIDFLSNGFKIRTSNPASGEISFGTRNYIFIAFAESPFKYSSAR